jgi:exosortase family protein XrtF
MLASYLNKGPVRFIVISVSLYAGLYMLYEFVIKPHTSVDEYIIHHLISVTESFYHACGLDLIQYEGGDLRSRVGIVGSTGVFIGEPCNGFVLFILFLAFIVAFPGPLKHKLWYIPAGILAIHFINGIRVIALVFIVYKKPEWLTFNHDYTFTILVYSFVFLLWWIWINKFSPLRHSKAAQ